MQRSVRKMKVIVTAGPTYEPIDPVRFIGNRSSGKQGYAIAASLAKADFDVTLISGPTALPGPVGLKTIRIETAEEMLREVLEALPADIAICAAAVSDYRPAKIATQKLKKDGENGLTLKLEQNPDILKTLSNSPDRPALVIGFAAETENLLENAKTKRTRKGCDWLLANLVAAGDKKVFGEDQNHVYLINSSGTQDWPEMSKTGIAERLTAEIVKHFEDNHA